MNKLTKAAILSAAVVLAGQAANAQDLILGFTSSSASTDYTIDLGAVSGLSSTGVTQLGSLVDLSTFNSAFSGGPNGVNAGVAGGGGTGAGGNHTAGTGDFVEVSVLRTGSVAFGAQGSESAPGTAAGPGGNNVTIAATQAASIPIGTPANTLGTSFTKESAGGAGSFSSAAGVNPLSTISGNTIIEDLFVSTRIPKSGLSTPSTAYSYAGSIEIDFSGATPVVEFFGKNFVAAVPEPATYGIFAGAGLLALSLRRQFRRSNA